MDIEMIGQFILCKTEAPVPQGWRVRCHGSWLLASHAKLPVMEMRARDGSAVGWLLGYPISPDGRLLSSTPHAPFDVAGDNAPAEFERSLYALGGRFAAIYLTPQTSRAYLDPAGNLAVVFAPEEQIVASSPNLVPRSENTREDAELVRAIGILERGTWYPFGLTPRRGVERLLPNHFLDLETWDPARHWPGPGEMITNEDTARSVAEIAAILERQIAAIVGAGPVYMSFTAGRHTRMLLACARSYLDRITFFTIPLPRSAQARLDCEVARRIAKRFGLNYVTLPWREPSQPELDQWLYRTGACVSGPTSRIARTLRQLDPSRGILNGILGGVGQQDFMHETDFEMPPVSCTDLLERIETPAVPEIVKRAERWLRALPVSGILWALDFLYLEQKLGPWGATQEYGYVDSAFLLSPYCHRRIVQLLLTLPHAYRYRNKLPQDLIKNRWPELLDFPFNDLPGLMGVLRHPRRTLRSVLRRMPSSLAIRSMLRV